MIAATSQSYPVQGASRAACVPYALALAWVDAPDHDAARAVKEEIIASCRPGAFADLFELLDDAWEDGHLRIRRRRPQLRTVVR